MKNQKITTLLTLILSSFVLSRALFVFFNDPEGPNLLIVTILAVFLFGVAQTVNKYYSKKVEGELKKLLLPILVQVVVVVGLHYLLK